MEHTTKYAIITAKHHTFGAIDIRVSRDMPVKEIIRNLFDALSRDKTTLQGYYAKGEVTRTLLMPTDTLRDKNIYDGEILRIL